MNSRCVIAILSGPCVNPEYPAAKPEDNAYLRRWMCMEELQWAIEALVPVIPVVHYLDKPQIGALLAADGPDGFSTTAMTSIKQALASSTIIDINRTHPANREAYRAVEVPVFAARDALHIWDACARFLTKVMPKITC